MVNPSEQVAIVVLEHSDCAEVFQRHRIDFCCRGDMSIEQAASERSVNVPALIEELDKAIAARTQKTENPAKDLSTEALIQYIVEKHHGYLLKTFPFVLPLAAKVARVHGDHNPKLKDLFAAVSELVETLTDHLADEENNLFPMLRRAETPLETKTKELGKMHQEHLSVAKQLERIRAAADDFSLPSWACNSYRTLFSELAVMEKDIFTHVHLENHVLMPRFVTQASGSAS
jgi:regulator of cell morphogenesis and NO signaling